MNKLSSYYNKNLGTLRVATINDEPYFIGKDIANILGYKDHKAALRKNVPDSEKRIIYSSDIDIYGLACNNDGQTSLTDYSIPFSGLTGLTISGLATFLGKTKKSKTPALKKWLEEEILPEITDEPISLSNTEKVEEVVEGDLTVIDNIPDEDFSTYAKEEFGKVRGTLIDDEPWLIGRDVATILGYSNVNDAIWRHVDRDDQGIVKHDTPSGEQNLVIINESGVYSLIFSSKLESAKRFKHWVTSEVLPSIRKHGAYATDATIDNIIADPDFGIRLLTQLKEERAKAKAAEEELERNKPLIKFATGVGESNTLIDMGEMAKLLCHNGFKIGRNKLFDFLRDQKVILKKKPVPYQEYVNRGYFELREINVARWGEPRYETKTLVTGTGQQFIFNLVQEHLMDDEAV